MAGAAAAAVAVPFAAVAQPVATLRVGASLDDGLTPLLYAMQAGIFKKYALDVQLQAAASGAALASAIVGGTVDIAKSSLMSLITAYARGVRFKIIAGAALYTSQAPTTELSVLTSSPIKSFSDVNGKTVACSALRSLDQMATQALIDKRGGNSSTVRFIELPFSAMLPALEQGRADMAAISNPVLAAALETGKIRTLGDPYDGIAKYFLIAGWFCTQSFASQNLAITRRFFEAMREAATYTNAHHAETVSLLADYSHIDPDVIRKMNRLTNATSLQASEIQPAIDAAAKYKFIDEAFSAKEFF